MSTDTEKQLRALLEATQAQLNRTVSSLRETEVTLSRREAELAELRTRVAPQPSPPSRATETPGHSCLRCRSTRLLHQVPILDQGPISNGPLTAAIETNPDVLFFKSAQGSALQLSVCLDCGHSEVYVTDPKALEEAVRRRGLMSPRGPKAL